MLRIKPVIMDIVDLKTRSRMMAAVRSRNTKPEILLRKALWEAGLRGYRLRKGLPGRPDMVFPRHKVAVFVDGCFWHGCPRCYKAPENNKAFWRAKLAENRSRDEAVNAKLRQLGWRVVRFWEHEVEDGVTKCIERIRAFIAAEVSDNANSRGTVQISYQ